MTIAEQLRAIPVGEKGNHFEREFGDIIEVENCSNDIGECFAVKIHAYSGWALFTSAEKSAELIELALS